MKPARSRIARLRSTLPQWVKPAALTGLALISGFLLLQTQSAALFFGKVTELLAILAGEILGFGGYDVARTGIELRDLSTGNAIAVTAACDGSGLLVTAVAALFWFRNGRLNLGAAAMWLALAATSIFAFNLVRVIVIFVALGQPELLHGLHLYVAPLLSSVLVALLVIRMDEHRTRRLWMWVGVAAALSIVWYFLAAPATCITIVPFANFLISILAGPLVSGIECGMDSATLLTTAATSLNPPSSMILSFFPADFTLGAPLVVASLIVYAAGRELILWAIGTGLSWALTMTLATITIAHDLAIFSGVNALIGESFRLPYLPPDPLTTALIKALQNALVHFNLLTLPFIICGARAGGQGGSGNILGRRR